jgi:hypothetical protein
MVVASVLLSLELSAQSGVITIEAKAEQIPFSQWYVSKEKGLENHQFFYSDDRIAIYTLNNILEQEGQSFNMPEGVDDDGDRYWIVTWESGFTSTIFVTPTDDFMLITIFTE